MEYPYMPENRQNAGRKACRNKPLLLREIEKMPPGAILDLMASRPRAAAPGTVDQLAGIPLLAKASANAPRLTAIAEEVMRVEGRSDDLHEQGLKDLFRRHRNGDAMAYMIGSEIYGQLEKVVDRFEDVANEISGIVIENV